jgi:hypothetical protein
VLPAISQFQGPSSFNVLTDDVEWGRPKSTRGAASVESFSSCAFSAEKQPARIPLELGATVIFQEQDRRATRRRPDSRYRETNSFLHNLIEFEAVGPSQELFARCWRSMRRLLQRVISRRRALSLRDCAANFPISR